MGLFRTNPILFAVCFLAAFVAMLLSWALLVVWFPIELLVRGWRRVARLTGDRRQE